MLGCQIHDRKFVGSTLSPVAIKWLLTNATAHYQKTLGSLRQKSFYMLTLSETDIRPTLL